MAAFLFSVETFPETSLWIRLCVFVFYVHLQTSFVRIKNLIINTL